MLPKTESSTVPCSNISSNCVVWQGPDIPCIELCTGDTISDVVAALAQQLCDLVIPEPNLDGLDLLCVLPQGQSQPDTVKDIFQLIVNYICDDEGEGEYQLPTLALPQCLYYDDPETGDPVTALPLDQYALLLANKICDILQAIDIINVTLSDHETRITILEDCVLPCTEGGGDPDVFSTCILENQTVAASVLLLALEEAFCDLQDAVGAPPLVSAAVNQAGCITSSDPMLSSAGTYGGVAGWTSTPTTLSHAVGNAWIVICDMHQAIKDIQLNCCPGACDDVVFAYTTTLVTNMSNVPTGIDFNFSGSSVPAGFNDCGGLTTIVVTDQNGVVANQTFTFVNYAGTSNILTFDLGSTSLNLADNLDVSISFCITDGVDQCDAVITDVVESSAPCPTDIAVGSITTNEAFLTFTNVLGTSAIYTAVLTDLTDGSSSNVFTATGLGTLASIHLTPLDENTSYEVTLSFQLNGVTTTCDTASFVTVEEETPCDAGIDLAIIMDYTASMSNDINAAKAGAASLVSVVDGQVGTNVYRMGLAIVDEYNNGAAPNYGANTEYTSLPSSQRYVDTANTPNSDIYITAMEMFANDNGATYQTQLDKLDNTIPLGAGANGPEPMDYALQLVVNQAFLGTFRPNVAKYVVLITDALPSGFDDDYNAPGENDDAFIANLTTACINQGITVMVYGPGAANTVYQNLATNTGGVFTTVFNSTTIPDAIQNACGGGAVGPECNSYTITSNDVHNDGDINYTDCSTGQATSDPVVGITSFNICSSTEPVAQGVAGSLTITNNGACST
jgi:hypothetical protein